MIIFDLLPICLNLFDGADGNSGNMVGSTANSGSDHLNGGSEGDTSQNPSEATSGGSNGESSDAEKTNNEAKVSKSERRAKFFELVEGEYKDIYEREFQKAFNRRYRDARENEERMQKLNPLLNKLMVRYNIDGNNVDALAKAIDGDRAIWESAAEDVGMTDEQYAEFLQAKVDSRRWSEAEEARLKEEEAEKQMSAWNDAVKEAKKLYSDFDIDELVEDERFCSMLRAGVPMHHAYEVLHLADIKNSVAKTTEKNVVEGIRAKGMRPKENGISSNNGIATNTDISKLGLSDIKSAIEKARRGEVVRFGG